jgi:hypothetical protein
MITVTIRLAVALRYYQLSARLTDLPISPIPTAFNALFRQCANLSLLRRPITTISQYWNINQLSIGFNFRLLLRSRLTLIRLTLIRKPEPFGVRVSHPHYRYLCLHLLFYSVHHALQHSFYPNRMLPYHPESSSGSIASVIYLMPVYYRCSVARPVSCYALFK